MLNKYKAAAIATPLLILSDQVAKGLIVSRLQPYQPFTLVHGLLELRYAENPGMAFSLLQNIPEALRLPLFTGINILAAVIMLRLLIASPPGNRRVPAALSLILAGALGNLIDRYRWGVVVDFIHFTVSVPGSRLTWPIFNFADIFISAGIALLLADALFATRPEAPEEDAGPGPEIATAPPQDLDPEPGPGDGAAP